MVKISFQDEYTHFWYPEQRIDIARGLNWVIRQSRIDQQLTAFAIENVIQWIEEMIEADQKIVPINGTAMVSDELFLQLSQFFFQGQQPIQRFEVESVFNEFVDRLEYFDLAEIPNKNKVIVYLIFVREMMHHLNIDTIYYQAEESFD